MSIVNQLQFAALPNHTMLMSNTHIALHCIPTSMAKPKGWHYAHGTPTYVVGGPLAWTSCGKGCAVRSVGNNASSQAAACATVTSTAVACTYTDLCVSAGNSHVDGHQRYISGYEVPCYTCRPNMCCSNGHHNIFWQRMRVRGWTFAYTNRRIVRATTASVPAQTTTASISWFQHRPRRIILRLLVIHSRSSCASWSP